MGALYICGTPIGNLEDSTYRLKKVLGTVDLILCEDTRRAKKLLDYLEIETPYESFFIGNEYKKNSRIISKIKGGERIALISDAGMPTISDPGSSLIEGAVKENIELVDTIINHSNNVVIELTDKIKLDAASLAIEKKAPFLKKNSF